VLAMNKTAYAELPADLKKIIDDNSGQLAAGMAGTMWDLKAKAVADAVSQGGNVIVTLEPETVAHWRKATEPVIAAWRKQMRALKIDSDKLLAGARTLIEKYASLPEPEPPQQPAPAKAETGPPAKSGGVTAMQSPAAPKVGVATPGSHSATTAPPQPPRTHWWEFWKSAPAPASATASAAPTVPPAPTTRWWQFWKSTSQPAPATASASAAPAVPSAPSSPAIHATAPVPKPAPVVTSPPPAAAIVKPAPVGPSAPPSKGLNIPL
jgi:Bacterial extracellular solute-binding protein, family 7